MTPIPEIKAQMKRAEMEMLTLGDVLTDYPDKQTEVYGAAEMLSEWQEEIGK